MPAPSQGPKDALDKLLRGNRRFATGDPVYPRQAPDHRQILTQAQKPFACVLGCSDSRASVELLFDQGFGDLFVIRNAGHVLGESVKASIEYAVNVLNVDIVFVLGHEDCGAIKATLNAIAGGNRLPGSMEILVDRVRPHLESIDDPLPPRRHVAGTMQDLESESEIVRSAVAEGRLVLAGGFYHLDTGLVEVVER